jgi:hypothetical protein
LFIIAGFQKLIKKPSLHSGKLGKSVLSLSPDLSLEGQKELAKNLAGLLTLRLRTYWLCLPILFYNRTVVF